MRRGRDYLLITNGSVGTAGFGNHKHNDLLGFEYHVDGAPVFVDPGSYVYTADPDARNLFRSTRSHNTLSVGDEEQNELRPDWLFRMFEQGPSTASRDRRAERRHEIPRSAITATHGSRSPSCTNARSRLSRGDGVVTILDVLTGSGIHRLRWHFHLAPGVGRPRDRGPVRRYSVWRPCCCRCTTPEGLRCTVGAAWYSAVVRRSRSVRMPRLRHRGSPAGAARVHVANRSFSDHAMTPARLVMYLRDRVQLRSRLRRFKTLYFPSPRPRCRKMPSIRPG